MSHKPFLKIIHLEDNPEDAELIRTELEDMHICCEVKQVITRQAFETALQSGDVDVILSDSNLPGFDAWDALAFARRRSPGISFIFVSGNSSPEAQSWARHRGAVDHISKDDLAPLIQHLREIARQAVQRPKVADPVLVECRDFPRLGYLDSDGVWRDVRDSSALQNVTGWEEL